MLKEVPPNTTAVGVPARIVGEDKVEPELLDQIHVCDPVAQDFIKLEDQMVKINEIINTMKKNIRGGKADENL